MVDIEEAEAAFLKLVKHSWMHEVRETGLALVAELREARKAKAMDEKLRSDQTKLMDEMIATNRTHKAVCSAAETLLNSLFVIGAGYQDFLKPQTEALRATLAGHGRAKEESHEE